MSFQRKSNVMLPTLPQNIRKISEIFETASRSLVIPADIPTVPMADATSKITSVTSSDVAVTIIRTAVTHSIRFVHSTVLCLSYHVRLSLRPEHAALSFVKQSGVHKKLQALQTSLS